jgi:HEAT repeat protein
VEDLAALAADPQTPAMELADAVTHCDDRTALPVLVRLARHADAEVRRAVAAALPILVDDESPAEVTAAVGALVPLTRDDDPQVRDWACFALGSQLREVDLPELRDALAACLSDEDTDARCEALLGLALRRDRRVLPVLTERLAADDVWALEIDAAGALGEPSLHAPIRSHLDGWDAETVPRVVAALRLTDPEGVGDDLLDGLADELRAGEIDADGHWWSIARRLFEYAGYRAPEIADAVRERLANDPDALARLVDSPLGRDAAAKGWTP